MRLVLHVKKANREQQEKKITQDKTTTTIHKTTTAKAAYSQQGGAYVTTNSNCPKQARTSRRCGESSPNLRMISYQNSLLTQVLRVSGTILTVELGLLQRLNLADVDVLHGVDALHSLEDLSGDVLGDAATRNTQTTTTTKQPVSQTRAHHPGHPGLGTAVGRRSKTKRRSASPVRSPYAVGISTPVVAAGLALFKDNVSAAGHSNANKTQENRQKNGTGWSYPFANFST